MQVQLKATTRNPTLLAHTHPHKPTVMHAAHGERRKVFPVLPVFSCSAACDWSATECDWTHSPLQPVCTPLYMKHADFFFYAPLNDTREDRFWVCHTIVGDTNGCILKCDSEIYGAKYWKKHSWKNWDLWWLQNMGVEELWLSLILADNCKT